MNKFSENKGMVLIRDQVFEAMRNAAENGYHFKDWSCRDIAWDMKACGAVGGEIHIETVESLVRGWLLANSKNKYRKGGE